MPVKPQFSDAVVDAAVTAFTRAELVKVKDTPQARAKFREIMRYVLERAAAAELDEAMTWANSLDADGPEGAGLQILAECLHTGWRKGCEDAYAPAIHRLISEMGTGWAEYTAWVGYALKETGWAYQEKDSRASQRDMAVHNAAVSRNRWR